MSLINCPTCNKEISVQATHCSRCGSQFITTPQKTRMVSVQKGKQPLRLSALIFMAVIALGIYGLLEGKASTGLIVLIISAVLLALWRTQEWLKD